MARHSEHDLVRAGMLEGAIMVLTNRDSQYDHEFEGIPNPWQLDDDDPEPDEEESS